LMDQVQPMVARLRLVFPTLPENAAPEAILMARLLVRDRGLVPRRNPCSRSIVEYDDRSVFPDLLTLAEKLVRRGLLERRLFDTLSTCPHCNSARVYARPSQCRADQEFDLPSMVHPSAGSICLDCGCEIPTDAIVGRLVYAYDLTEQV